MSAMRPLSFALSALVLAFSVGMAGPLHAQVAAPTSTPTPASDTPLASRPWHSLTPIQRELLAPLQPRWDRLSPRHQSRMLQHAERWATLPPARRAAISEHIAHWQQMTPDERAQARRNMRKYHALSPQQREQLHAAFERFQQLPPDQRKQLMHQWRALSPEQRLHWSAPAASQSTGGDATH